MTLLYLRSDLFARHNKNSQKSVTSSLLHFEVIRKYFVKFLPICLQTMTEGGNEGGGNFDPQLA